MPSIIYGLERQGYTLWNDVTRYIHVTHQPDTLEIKRAIYHEVLSQIVNRLDPDFQRFLQNLMTLPVWATIHYTGEPIDHDKIGFFRDSVRATGILLWHTIERKTGVSADHFYCLEASDMTYVLIGVYLNAEQL